MAALPVMIDQVIELMKEGAKTRTLRRAC